DFSGPASNFSAFGILLQWTTPPMNYSDQQRFFAAYDTRWLIASAALIILASLALREPTFATIGFVVLIVGCAGALSYLPKYLHLHHESDKRYAWAVRARWIMSIAAILLPAAFRFSSLPVILVAAGAALWMALVNGFVLIAFRNERVIGYRW